METACCGRFDKRWQKRLTDISHEYPGQKDTNMIQLSIILAIIVGGLAPLAKLSPPGLILLSVFINKHTIKEMSQIEQFTLFVLFNYIVVSVIIYFILRISRLDTILIFKPLTKILFSISIIIYIFLNCFRFYVLSSYGSSVGFIVSIIESLFVLPALAMIIVGMANMIVNSINNRLIIDREYYIWQPLSRKEYSYIFLILLFPAIFIASMHLNPSSEISLARISQKSLDDECNSANEYINEYGINITCVYIDRDYFVSFENINKNNEYNMDRNSISYVSYDMISFYEKINAGSGKDYLKYIYYDKEFPKGKKTNNLQSNYGVYWESIPNVGQQGSDVKKTLRPQNLWVVF